MQPSDQKDKFGTAKVFIAIMAFTLIMALASIISAERFIWQIDDSKSLIGEQRQLFGLQSLSDKLQELSSFEELYAHSHDKSVLARRDAMVNLLKATVDNLQLNPERNEPLTEMRLQFMDAVKGRLELDARFFNSADSVNSQETQQQLLRIQDASKKIDTEVSNLQNAISQTRDTHDSEMNLARGFVDQILTLLWMFVVVAGGLLARQTFQYVIERRKMETLVKGAESRFREAERSSEEKAARLAAIFETAPVGIVTLTADGIIESCNDATLNIFGHSSHDLISTQFRLLVPTFNDILAGMQETFKAKSSESKVVHFVTDTTGIKADGTKFHMQLALSLLSLPIGILIIGVIDDITPREAAQQKIRDFYSTVSHELRTPLTSVRTALGLLDSFQAEKQNPQVASVLDIAQTELDRLIRLINDMLDIRKIEEGKLVLRMSDVSVQTLAKKATDAMSALAGASSIEIDTQLNYKGNIYCDEDRIIQILTNLLSNAVKFSPPKSTVRLLIEQLEDVCLFSVFDSGPGISDEDLEKLFRKYEQLSLYDGKQRAGTGLGLAIAKAITEEHKGSIGVDNKTDIGTRFWFSIPIVESDEKESAAEGDISIVAKESSEKTLKI